MHSHHDTHGAPLKLWDSHGPFEPQAMQQLRNIASLPFIHNHVAGMPDVHLGKGARSARSSPPSAPSCLPQ